MKTLIDKIRKLTMREKKLVWAMKRINGVSAVFIDADWVAKQKHGGKK